MKCLDKNRQVEMNNPNRESVNDPTLWLPSSKELKIEHNYQGIRLPTRGEYDQGFPVGAVVHFTAGWQKHPKLSNAKLAQNTLEGAKKNGFTFLVIDADGIVYQSHPMNRWGYHAGKSSWPNLGHSLSNKLVGIEVMCPGRVDKSGDNYKTWYGQIIKPEDIRETDNKENIKAGAYVKFTYEQEQSLIGLLRLLHGLGEGVFSYHNIVGHDEIAPNRKDDPGHSLSLSMPKFRKMLLTGTAR